MSHLSMYEPGSPSSALQTMYASSAFRAFPAVRRHFVAVGNPAPPRPRSCERSTSASTSSGVIPASAFSSPAKAPCFRAGSSFVASTDAASRSSTIAGPPCTSNRGTRESRASMSLSEGTLAAMSRASAFSALGRQLAVDALLDRRGRPRVAIPQAVDRFERHASVGLRLLELHAERVLEPRDRRVAARREARRPLAHLHARAPAPMRAEVAVVRRHAENRRLRLVRRVRDGADVIDGDLPPLVHHGLQALERVVGGAPIVATAAELRQVVGHGSPLPRKRDHGTLPPPLPETPSRRSAAYAT